MRGLLLVLLTAAACFTAYAGEALLDAELVENTVEVYTEVDGELEGVTVDAEAFAQVLNHSQYQCVAVPGGYQRCSKRTGRCFGGVFASLRQCNAVLHPDDD